MYISETKFRVRYADTDKMGVVYYGNYPAFYETGRNEALRQIGSSYKEMEESGVMMPVADMHIKYIRPAKYDDLLTIKTIIPEIPTSARMYFTYEIYNQDNVLINAGETTLVFLDIKTNKPVRAPEWFTALIRKHF
jgi:acyl-CoA thioester hydrolase